MKKLHRYIFREITVYFLLSLFLLTFLLLVNQIFQLTDLVINRGVPVIVVGKMLLAILPVFLILTLPMSVLVACILTFSRLSTDSEFVAMTASGMSLYSQLVPVSILGIFAALFSAFLMAFALPWSHEMTANIRKEIIQGRATGFEIKEQVFNDSFDGLVIYVRKMLHKRQAMQGILISDTRDPKDEKVIVADRGRMIPDPKNQRFIIRLNNGTMHRVNNTAPGKKSNEAAPQTMDLKNNQYQVLRFGSYDLNLDLKQSIDAGAKELRVRLRSLPVHELRQKLAETPKSNRRYNAFLVEIQKRFATPLACLVLALLGAPLGVQNRRSGRHGGFALSLLVLFLYYILANFSFAFGESGTLNPVIAVWGPNFILLLVSVWAIRKVVRDGAVDILVYLVRLLSLFPYSRRLISKSA